MNPSNLSKDLLRLFAKTKLDVLKENFLVISLPLKETMVIKNLIKWIRNSFFSFSIDREEITLVIPETEWAKISVSFNKVKIQRNYKVIGLNVKLEWIVVGYIATISKLLAENNISVGIISTYSKDNLLIKKVDLPKTITILENFINECKRLVGE